ncbi:hypothetical protein AvCA_29260 [Azotobacter vinelandii CA]|uniref:DUF469 family protein n=3 Tax=Azotobacter group TaxID=351 RepID=C1DM08_AZOVD|nr:conserved hypothetical protein [Azotobacter vinelandii DJ]AGK14815.1 hypothetical protein AvCA_29260 [Azotobacter vinelandii CA]AGK20963.1 hypothetical protein AvCA6_29260 [Azotobacter vinelandii CA6]
MLDQRWRVIRISKGLLNMKTLSPAEMLKPRKRRLRKKLRLSEFQEFYFRVTLQYERTQIDLDTLLDLWIDFVEAHKWSFAGGGSPESGACDGLLCLSDRGSMTEADRELVREWLDRHPWCLKADIGPLKDCWHEVEPD